MVRPWSCRVIYYFDTPALGRKHQSFGRVTGGWLWLQLEEEEAEEACKGDGKLAVGTVGVAEERVATLTTAGKEKKNF